MSVQGLMAEKRILIAEDDRATRESWSELLSSWGYKVEVTEDGQQALEAALRRRPQIILADLKMARIFRRRQVVVKRWFATALLQR